MRREDIFRMCVQNLLRRKSRTLLTLLGVLIGCCSIVIMVSIGIGTAESQKKMLAEMGDLTIITVSPKQSGAKKEKLDQKAIAAMTIDDILKMQGVTVTDIGIINELQKSIKANKVIAFLGGGGQ